MNDHSCSTCSGHGHLIPEPHFRPLPGSGTPVIELRGISFAYDDLFLGEYKGGLIDQIAIDKY